MFTKINPAYYILLILITSCKKQDAACIAANEFTVRITSSQPCTSTGIVTVETTEATMYQYKLDDGSYQANTNFVHVSAGKHTITLLKNNRCESKKEIVVDTLPKGPLFTDVAAILKANCARCHSGLNPQAGLDFTTPCDVLNNWQRIEARAINANPTQMPPSGLIPIEQRNRIAVWINAGHRFVD